MLIIHTVLYSVWLLSLVRKIAWAHLINAKNDDIARGMALHILTSKLLTRGHSILPIVGKQCSTMQSNLNGYMVIAWISD